jgi:hypothetical protein
MRCILQLRQPVSVSTNRSAQRLDCDAAKSIRLKKLSQEALAEPAARDAAQHQMDKGLGIEERAEIAAQRGKKVVGIRGTV